jgi:hypothetical protein
MKMGQAKLIAVQGDATQKRYAASRRCILRSERSPDERSDIRDFYSVNPACRCAHAGYRTRSAPARAAEFLEPFQADLPCPVVARKIFLFPSDPNHRLIPCRPVPNEGRFAIVTGVRRDAVDAKALLTNSAEADGEVVWS